MKILQIMVLCGLLFGNISVTAGQMCDSRNYTLDETPRRSTMATFDNTVDTALCDSNINEALWYRFLSNGGEKVVEKAANDSVPINRCGTPSPIYIRGLNSHPSVDSTTLDATVCANFGGNPCNWMETIQIHRCPAQGNQSVYFLYKLKPPPGCSLSYCVGEKPPCNRGDYWDGFSCVNYFPPMTGFPLFGGPYTTGSGFTMEVYFTCRVQYARRVNDTNARFRVTFLFDGQTLERVKNQSTAHFEDLHSFYLTAANSSTQIFLRENHLRGRLGREISCKAESYWDGYEPASELSNSTMLSQTKFYAALESEYSSHILNPSQGATFTIVFRSTLPFTCRHCTTMDCCYYDFRMRSEVASTCIAKWTGGYTTSVQVYILPGLQQSPVSYGMDFVPYNGDFTFGSSSLWRDYIIPPVTVETVPSSISYLICRSRTDPYIYPFDGGFFSNFQVGDFHLVSSQSMEVQVRQEVCGSVSCNCGVIVREGNSAFKISICEKGPWNTTVQRSPSVIRLLSQDPVDSSAVYRDGTGKLFSIRMPSGLRVEFDTTSPWFNIDVHLPPVYHGKTSSNSMCGDSDGFSSDDMQNANNPNYFRIADVDNYFKRQPECSVFNPAVKRCGDCEKPAIGILKCSNTDNLLQVVSKPQDILPDRWNTGVVCRPAAVFAAAATLDDSTITDSDFVLDSEVVFPPYSYDPNFGVNVSFIWPTPKGKTETAVTQYCENVVSSSLVYQDCNASVDVATIIRACKTDIQIIDEWLPGGAYTSDFEGNCLNQLAASINSSNADSNSTLSNLTSVYEKTCTNQCSGHGTCVEANCVCNQGYIGTDCGIQDNQPPLLTGIVRNGICDVRLRPCNVISVLGSGIVSTAALKCRFMDQSTGSYVETNGTFITSGEYSCPVPGTTTHRRKRATTPETTAISATDVSITMNGNVYSNNIPFVVFDSTCMQCNDSRACNQRSDACTINGQCYADAVRNTNNRCLQCLPETSNSSWTDTTVVQGWKPCTRQCDYGARSRATFCNGTLESAEVELCKLADCPENLDEKHEGVGFTFSEEDLGKILLNPVVSLVPFSDALNQYCSKNAAACCNSIGMETHGSNFTYTSPELLTYASGYPLINSTDTSLKIIVKIDRAKLAAECSQTPTQGSNVVYGAPNLLCDAVTSEKSEIEQELGVTIKSVWSSEPVTSEPVTPQHATPEHTTPEHTTPEHTTPEHTMPEPVTPEPVTTEHATLEHTTPEPVTPEPVTPQPVTPQPVTPEPVTPQPATPEPVTPEPVTLEDATPKHTTPEPVTPEPVTPKPATPEPVTPEPVTLEDATPKHTTPEPVTPEPVTPKPATPKPITPEPITSKPVTPKPATPKPVVPKPKPGTRSTASATCSSLFLLIGTYFFLKVF